MINNNKQFVFSDTETTGTKPIDFVQIIQSASILTDKEFNNLDTHESSCKPLPWIVPSLGAYLVHKKVATLDCQKSHYHMMQSIHNTWSEWSKNNNSIFVTYNGHKFDEELYRRQFFWNLLDPFVTNTNGNGRLDLLMLVRLISQLYPEKIDFEISTYGYPVCKLESVIQRIGVDSTNAHDALADCIFMVKLSEFIQKEFPDLFNEFLQQATKTEFENYLQTNEVIGYRYQPFARYWTYPLTCIGINPINNSQAICIDLNYPIDEVLQLSHEEMMGYLQKPNAESPFKIVPINKSQGIANAEKHNFAFDEDMKTLKTKARKYRESSAWVNEVLQISCNLDPKEWPQKHYVEETIYEKFFSNHDKQSFQRFHNASTYEEKFKLIETFEDLRAKEFGYRILFQLDPSRNLQLKNHFTKLRQERWQESDLWFSGSDLQEELNECLPVNGEQAAIKEALNNYLGTHMGVKSNVGI